MHATESEDKMHETGYKKPSSITTDAKSEEKLMKKPKSVAAKETSNLLQEAVVHEEGKIAEPKTRKQGKIAQCAVKRSER